MVMRSPAARGNPARRHQPRAAEYLLCYAFFLVTIGLSYAAFLVWRATSVLLIYAVLGGGDANFGIYAATMVVIGLALFCVVMWAEPYLRKGVERGDLGMHFVCVALPLGGAIALGLALTTLIQVLAA